MAQEMDLSFTADEEGRGNFYTAAIYQPEIVRQCIVQSRACFSRCIAFQLQPCWGWNLNFVDRWPENSIWRIVFPREWKDEYEFIIIRLSSFIGLAYTLNALCAAKKLLIPLQCEFFALEGIVKLLQTYEQQVKEKIVNTSLDLLGIVLTMHDNA